MFISNFGRGKNWLEGTVVGKQGPLTYKILLEDGRIVRRHLDHVRHRLSSTDTDVIASDSVDAEPDKPQSLQPVQSNTDVSTSTASASTSAPLVTASTDLPPKPPDDTTSETAAKPTAPDCSQTHSPSPTFVPRRSQRHVKPPDKLNI